MKFKIGYTVYCLDHEKTGTITDIKPTEEYPIYVTFEDGTTDTYTKSGKRLKYADKYLELTLEEDSTYKKEAKPLNLECIKAASKIFSLSLSTIRKWVKNYKMLLEFRKKV